MSIMVKDILKFKSLQEMSLVGGERGLQKSIEWMYIGEYFTNPLEIGQWLKGGEIVYITGVAIKDDTGQLIKLIQEINDKKAVGLIVNVGPYIKKVPKEAIDVANELELPIFELPWETKLVEVSQEICNAIIVSNIEENSLTQFLSNILFGSGEFGIDVLEKINYFGYNISRECHIGVVDIDDFSGFIKNKEIKDEETISKVKLLFGKIVEDILEKYRLKVPLIYKNDCVIFLNRFEDARMVRLNSALREIQRIVSNRIEGITVSVGIGNPYKDLKMMKQSLNEAEVALETIKCEGKQNTVINYKDIGIYGLLFSIPNKETLREYYLDNLGALADHDVMNDSNLFQTLETYLEENCNITITAEKLFLHRNTLKYRIKKIEELLDCHLHDFNDCANLKIAVYIKKILKKNHTLSLID
ncbi:PucR family transcriptional regulator [Clostridium vincentii]|uniref:Purine catabolism regulatory protein n=1 Tax=Clostridium vincentii TaxID=52704 RepID=A0A2T0BE25_9CLOT|nr:PucR family transcriptional regulator [Clostridium vincentii]PRR82140.1 Purine catabolism regulatory protein [Clostridium vincentii]